MEREKDRGSRECGREKGRGREIINNIEKQFYMYPICCISVPTFVFLFVYVLVWNHIFNEGASAPLTLRIEIRILKMGS